MYECSSFYDSFVVEWSQDKLKFQYLIFLLSKILNFNQDTLKKKLFLIPLNCKVSTKRYIFEKKDLSLMIILRASVRTRNIVHGYFWKQP